MVEVTDEIAKKMMAGTAYESVALEDALTDMEDDTKKEEKKENKFSKETEKPVREYTDEEKNRFAQILRAKYSDRTMTDYIQCQEYLESKRKHLANAKQAQEKLRSQALTYMQSIMDKEKRKTLPKDVLADVAKHGAKFIEKFGYDADGATNPITMKFRDWMDRNKDNLQKIQEVAEKTSSGSAISKTGTTRKTSLWGAIWEEKQSVKVGAFLMGFGGACLGAMASGPQGAVLGGMAGATAGAGLVATVIAVDKNKAVKQAKKAAKAQEKINQNQQQKEQGKTEKSKVDWNEVGFWGKMIAGCSAVGAGIGGFMAYTAAHATALGVAGNMAAITTSIGTGAIVGALAVPTMVAAYKVGSWIKEKITNKISEIKTKSQEKKQTVEAKSKSRQQVKEGINWHSVKENVKASLACSIGGGIIGGGLSYAAVHATAAGVVAGGTAVATAAATGAVIGAAAIPVALVAGKTINWIKNRFNSSSDQKHVKEMGSQTLTQAREQTEKKIHNQEKQKSSKQQGRSYKGKITDSSMKKTRQNSRSA